MDGAHSLALEHARLSRATGARGRARRGAAAGHRRGRDGQDRGAGAPPRPARRATGSAPSGCWSSTSTRGDGRRSARRVEALLDGPYEELWIGTWETIGERLLREHSDAAGLDPFFDVLGPAERLAMLLDRLDDLPLRRPRDPRQPGRPARPPAAADRRPEGGLPIRPSPSSPSSAPPTTRSSPTPATSTSGDLFLTLNRLLTSGPTSRAEIAARFRY